jgi:hypothetical protein
MIFKIVKISKISSEKAGFYRKTHEGQNRSLVPQPKEPNTNKS